MTPPDDADPSDATWVEHLESGGTTPWVDWVRAGRPVAATGAAPGAAALDLLRRLNERGHRAGLAPRIERRAAPGRGAAETLLPDSPPAGTTPATLAGSDDPLLRDVAARYPDVAPRGEVLRLVAGVVADLALELDTDRWQWRPDPVQPPRRPGGPTYHLVGAGAPVADLRSRLAAAGRPEGGRRRLARTDVPDLLLVVAGPLGPALADFWSWRVKLGATRSWRAVVARAAQRDELPAALDYARLAEETADRVGASAVHVLTPDGIDDQVAGLLGTRPAGRHDVPQVRRPVDPLPLPPAHVDVVRRANAVLPFAADEPRLTEARRALVAVLAEDTNAPGPPALDLPGAHRAWLERRARTVADELGASGATVHGDLSSVYEWTTAGRPRLASGEVLDAAVAAVLRLEDAARGGEAR